MKWDCRRAAGRPSVASGSLIPFDGARYFWLRILRLEEPYLLLQGSLGFPDRLVPWMRRIAFAQRSRFPYIVPAGKPTLRPGRCVRTPPLSAAHGLPPLP